MNELNDSNEAAVEFDDTPQKITVDEFEDEVQGAMAVEPPDVEKTENQKFAEKFADKLGL